MTKYFDPPAFSPGVPSRSLRSRIGLLRAANDAGIIPPEEWEAVRAGAETESFRSADPARLFECLEGVPVRPGRRGSEADAKLHYSVELWRKSKGLNRGRSVLACSLAHLIAMKTLVEGRYDFILEDNVRCPTGRPRTKRGEFDDTSTEHSDTAEAYCECAERIWGAMEASDAAIRDGGWVDACHLRYYGWLGSLTNLQWVINVHGKRRAFSFDEKGHQGLSDDYNKATVFAFPMNSDLETESSGDGEENLYETQDIDADERAGDNVAQRKPGGTLIWGAYAYWISREGLDAVLASLQNDVGALLWNGKRMRCYSVKPIDKIMPRRVAEHLGRDCIHVSSAPAFFRAPMLTSKIHQQWDAEFCRSTEYQMGENSLYKLTWDDLWLADDEREIVEYNKQHGVWLSMAALSRLKAEED